MEPGKKTASSLEEWRAMLKKAHTNEEFTAVALALPDRETQELWWPTTENPSSSITELKIPLD
jgi:hypothetical protein